MAALTTLATPLKTQDCASRRLPAARLGRRWQRSAVVGLPGRYGSQEAWQKTWRCQRAAIVGSLGRPAASARTGLGVRPVQQRLHIADGKGGAQARVAAHARNVVRDDHAVELHLPQRLHDLVHVHVAIVDERLDEVRQWMVDVAEVHLEELALAPKVANGLQHRGTHALAALQPAAGAEADADIRA